MKEFWRALDGAEKKKLAEAAGTSVAYLSQVVNGHRRCPATLAVEFEKASGGKVRAEDCCPDVDWAAIRATPCECKEAAA